METLEEAEARIRDLEERNKLLEKRVADAEDMSRALQERIDANATENAVWAGRIQMLLLENAAMRRKLALPEGAPWALQQGKDGEGENPTRASSSNAEVSAPKEDHHESVKDAVPQPRRTGPAPHARRWHLHRSRRRSVP